MNICMFTNSYFPHVGGVAKSVASFEADLRKLGHRVLIVAPTYPDLPADEDESHVLRVPALQNFNGSDFSARIPIPFLIRHKIDSFNPDIIHSHHPYLLGETGLRASAMRNLPLVFTHHTLYEEYTHYVSSSSAMKKYIIRLSTLYANFCSHVIAPSRSIADMIQNRGVTSPVAEIPTGVDLDRFQNGDGSVFRQSVGIDDHVQLIGHVGRLAPEKNLGFLIKAVMLYLHQNTGAKFLLVGDGPDLESIKNAFTAEGLEDRLIAVGKKTGDDLVNAYCAMDLFVFSSHSETQGLVVAESMAAGKPVIALDATGVREVVSDNENGRLLPSGADVEAFAQAIADSFQDPDMLTRWGEKALATARQFGRMAMAGKLANLYAHVNKRELKAHGEYSPVWPQWENLLHGLKSEWDLLTGKVGAIADSMGLLEDVDE